MSGKAIPLLVAGTGGTVVAAGGNFLLQRSGDSTADGTSSTTTGTGNGGGSTGSGGAASQIDTISNDLFFKTLADFKQANGGDCAKYFVNGSNKVDLSKGGTEIDGGSNKIEANYFDGNEDAKSCLVINWEKTDTASGATTQNWKGNFRWVWSFVKGNKGFIMFTTTKLSSVDKQLDLEGGIYFLNKSGDSWSVDKHKTLQDKKITSDQFDNEFSKPGESLIGLTNTDSWGFMTSKTDLDSVCKSNEDNCTTDTDKTKTFKGSWTWSKSDNPSQGTLIKWCKDFDSYFSSMYEASEIALKVNLENLSGVWKKETLQEPSNA